MTEQERNILKQLALDGAEATMPRLLELLKNICSLDSGTGNVAGNQAVIDLLLPVLEELGAVVEPVHEPGLGTHLVARVRPQEQPPKGKILLIAHLDTVFAEGFAAQHPFRIEGDWVHGLGSGDCKSGVLIALSDETIQLFVEGRSGQITDEWLDSAGVLFGLLCVGCLVWLIETYPAHRRSKTGGNV